MVSTPNYPTSARSDAAKNKNRNPCMRCQKLRQRCIRVFAGPCARCVASGTDCEPSRELSKGLVIIQENPGQSYGKPLKKGTADSTTSTESGLSEVPETPMAYEPSYVTGAVYNEPENLGDDGTIVHESVRNYKQEPNATYAVEEIVEPTKAPAAVETTGSRDEYWIFADPSYDLPEALKMAMGDPQITQTLPETTFEDYELAAAEPPCADLGDLGRMQLGSPYPSLCEDASFPGEELIYWTFNPSLVDPRESYADSNVPNVCIDPRATMRNPDIEASNTNFSTGMTDGMEASTSKSTSEPAYAHYILGGVQSTHTLNHVAGHEKPAETFMEKE